MLMDNLIEKENKNKIRTENDIFYCRIKTCYHMSVTSTYCAMYSFVDFENFAFINKHEKKDLYRQKPIVKADLPVYI